MTTSISSEALLPFDLTERPTDKIFVEYTIGMCTQKMRALSYIGAEKITFQPKPDRHTYRQMDGH